MPGKAKSSVAGYRLIQCEALYFKTEWIVWEPAGYFKIKYIVWILFLTWFCWSCLLFLKKTFRSPARIFFLGASLSYSSAPKMDSSASENLPKYAAWSHRGIRVWYVLRLVPSWVLWGSIFSVFTLCEVAPFAPWFTERLCQSSDVSYGPDALPLIIIDFFCSSNRLTTHHFLKVTHLVTKPRALQ